MDSGRQSRTTGGASRSFVTAPLVLHEGRHYGSRAATFGGPFHIYMYLDPDPMHEPKKADCLTHVHEFEKYRLENRAHELFGV